MGARSRHQEPLMILQGSVIYVLNKHILISFSSTKPQGFEHGKDPSTSSDVKEDSQKCWNIYR